MHSMQTLQGIEQSKINSNSGALKMKYEITVDAYGHWAICEENGGDVIADLMTKQNAEKICLLLNRKHVEWLRERDK